MAFVMHRVGDDFDLFFQVIVILTCCLRLVVSTSSKHLRRLLLLLLSEGFGTRSGRGNDQGALGGNCSTRTSSDLWLGTRGFLHARFEIVHVSLALVDLLDGGDLFLRLTHIEVAGGLYSYLSAMDFTY